MKKLLLFLGLTLTSAMLLTSCGNRKDILKDGYYTAQMADFDTHGWKEFITIFVQNGEIVTVEYNAENRSGFIKSWDMAYMRTMNAVSGTYPNRYTRTYSAYLLEDQSADNIDAVTGATHSHHTFEMLAEAVIAKSIAGDMTVAKVSAD